MLRFVQYIVLVCANILYCTNMFTYCKEIGELHAKNFDFHDLTRDHHHIKKPLYEPIRIHPHFSEMPEFKREDIEVLKSAVFNAINFFQNTLFILRTTGPILLKRTGCRSSWQNGTNAGKCSYLIQGYRFEKCLDEFAIPDEHLEGLIQWPYEGNKPSQIKFETGEGIPDSDFVLYVSASTTPRCLKPRDYLEFKHSVIGYASFCQLGLYDRPVAGWINFCPLELHYFKFDLTRLYLTSVHEIIHTLGFTRDLFEKFQDCTKSIAGENCIKRDPPLYHNIEGIIRLLTPKVIEKMQEHFFCNDPNFGAPLQVLENQIQSHWDNSLLHGTIMTPTLGLTNLIAIDPITLAVFEDSGWYKVNYQQAQKYSWGRGEGCQFGIKKCSNSEFDAYFCNEGSKGCHYLHTSKADCEATEYDCGIFTAKPVTFFCPRPCKMSSASSNVYHVHRDLYKIRTPPWKESYRQRCLDRLRENRSELQMRFRKIGDCKDSFIKKLMREELLDMKHHQNEIKSSKEKKIEEDLLEDFDIDQVLSMFEDIQDELRLEELKLLQEFDKYEDSLHREESVLCSAIEKLCTEEVVCPLCQKYPILLNKAVIFCKCGMRINTEQDCLTLSNIKSMLESGVKEHNSICEAIPTFTVVSEFGIQNLLLSCQDCDWMSVII